MNYIEEQEYYNAIKKLQYYQAIKDRYDFMIREERAIQELNQLKRYANDVVYPAIEQAKRAKEESIRSKEQQEKTKRDLRDLKNAYKEYQYNKEMRKKEPDRLVDDGNGGKKILFTIHRRLPPELEEKE